MNKFRYWLVIVCFLPGVVFAANAQLLLVRNAEHNTTCDVSVYHGKLYAVPNSQDLNNVNSTLGLSLLTNTQELPFEDNFTQQSSIPIGTYTAKIRNDETKMWMKGKPDRTWRLELIDVNRPRSAIQLHYGKDKSWSQGCIILTGNIRKDGLICKSGEPDSPDGAVTAVRNYVERQVKNSSDLIRIRIVEWPDSQ